MYSAVYIKYHCKREVEEAPSPSIKLEYLGKIKFKKPKHWHWADKLVYDKWDIEHLDVSNFNKNIYQSIRVNPEEIVKNDYMYIPFISDTVTPEVLYSEEEVIRKYISWLISGGMIIEYEICRDPSTYDIKLCEKSTIKLAITKANKKEFRFLVKNSKIIPNLGESQESFNKRLKSYDDAVMKENRMIKEQERIRVERELERVKKEALIEKLSKLGYEELQEFFNKPV